MSYTDSLRDAAQRIDTAIEGLAALQKLTNLGGSDTTAILAAIDAGLRSVVEMFSGATSPEITKADIDAAVQSITDKLAANNSEIKAEIDKKFDPAG
jgi:hypothetical protein